jgi:prevent-host-death family protein
MSETLAVRDAETRLSELIERASQGEDIVITQGGHAVARIVPFAPLSDLEFVAAPVDLAGIATALAELRREVAVGGGPIPLATLLDWRDEGRH